jgi:hypothetical protein
LQALLGYYHHVLFVKLRRRTFISYAHIVLGWIILSGGWLNTFMYVPFPPLGGLHKAKLLIKYSCMRSGFRMGGISTPLIVVWFVWLVLVSIVMVKAPTLSRLVKRPEEDKGMYDVVEQDEPKERKRSSDETLHMETFAVGE